MVIRLTTHGVTLSSFLNFPLLPSQRNADKVEYKMLPKTHDLERLIDVTVMKIAERAGLHTLSTSTSENGLSDINVR